MQAENVLMTEEGVCKLCDFGSATTVVMTPTNQREIAWVEDNISRYATALYRYIRSPSLQSDT
jgi:AP2-associated kinase